MGVKRLEERSEPDPSDCYALCFEEVRGESPPPRRLFGVET